MAFRTIRRLADAQNDGRMSFCSFRKVPSQASVAGWWVDLSMAAGNPPPNFYASAPLVAATLDSFRGIFHGDAKAPSSTYLTSIGLTTPTAALVGAYRLFDYLVYYPFVDLDDTDAQTMDNTIVLPRYADGAGVRAIMVCVAPTTGGGSFTFDYVNQDGNVATAPTQSCSVASASIASVITSEQATVAGGNLMMRLAGGDTGMRSLVSWTNIVPNGGLASIVLVRPLASLAIREINTTTELEYVREMSGMPTILDGAYLHLMMNCAATVAAGQLSGYASFVWD